MQIRDISVKKRLLFANFVMVFVPVCLLAVMGAAIFTGLRFSGAAQQRELALLWPEQGPALSVQFAISALRVKADKKDDFKIKKVREELDTLEALGIHTLVLKEKKVLYSTPGADSAHVQATVQKKCGTSQSALLWDDEIFVFHYTAPHTGITIMAAGNVPFLAKGSVPEKDLKELLETGLLIFLGIAIAIIVFWGIYLSRLLSRQILEPLATLRTAAAAIQSGNLDVPLNISTRDELGATCRDFDRMRHELKIAKEAKEKYEQNRKELIAGISHDLSTPLTSLKGYASGILDGIAHTPEKRQHYVEMIYHTACNMEKLVDSLFLFSKLDLGRMPFHAESVQLAAYFADFTAENHEPLAARGLQLTFENPEIPAFVSIDRSQFQRVIENLLENSLKYKQDATVRVQISLEQQEDQLKIAFIDDGIGVLIADLPKIFDSFYRTDPSRTNVAKGSGLGLAIVKQIIIGLYGEIWAEQTPGGGLTICLRLPIVKGATHEKNIDC